MSAGKKWLVEASVAPTVICPGRFFASARNSCQLFHGVFGLAGKFQRKWAVHGDQSVAGNGASDGRGVVHHHGIASWE